MSPTRGLLAGDGRLRITPWRGDRSTAYLTPARGRPSAGAVRRCLDQLDEEGFRAAVTTALATGEQAPFLAAGFAVHERLHLLARPIGDLPDAPVPAGVQLRRGRQADRPEVLAVDHRTFPPFWRLDDAALDDAMAATPSSRLRVAVDARGGVVAYAVTGRAGSRGYLQRLAVDPEVQHRGLGSALVVDGLRWLRRWGAREVLVNTQEGNLPAVCLYQRLGFELQRDGLAVLHRSLSERSATGSGGA